MEEFKLNYFITLYKDEPLGNTKVFREMFIKKHGEFRLINEIIIQIVKYQVNTYGETLIRGQRMYKNRKRGRVKWK